MTNRLGEIQDFQKYPMLMKYPILMTNRLEEIQDFQKYPFKISSGYKIKNIYYYDIIHKTIVKRFRYTDIADFYNKINRVLPHGWKQQWSVKRSWSHNRSDYISSLETALNLIKNIDNNNTKNTLPITRLGYSFNRTITRTHSSKLIDWFNSLEQSNHCYEYDPFRLISDPIRPMTVKKKPSGGSKKSRTKPKKKISKTNPKKISKTKTKKSPKIHTGPRGGKYIVKKGKKIYQ